jgi:ribosomal protein S18 acetylase RimI-like enzyme
MRSQLVADTVRLSTADAGELLTLQRAAYVTEAQLHHDPRLPPLVEPLADVEAVLADPDVVVLGLRLGPRLVGCVRLRYLGDGRVALGRLAVAPDLQGRGLGTALLRAAEEAFDGVESVELFTGHLSAGNLRLYQRFGYVETHRTPAGTHELVHLVKELGTGDLTRAGARSTTARPA